MPLFDLARVVVRGAGDLASGVAYRLMKAGFPVLMTELAKPYAVRLPVCYAMAVLYETVIIEGIVARRADLTDLEAIHRLLSQGIIPVLVDPEGEVIRALQPPIVVDCRMAKSNLGTAITDAPLVVALGPGFRAGIDCHAVVETNRGHNLGRVYWRGEAEPDTGIPGKVDDRDYDRVLRAPIDGYVRQVKLPGQRVEQGQLVARIGEVPIFAPISGVLRGLTDDDQVYAHQGMKIGDIDPRGKREQAFTISDKSLAIGGGVVEAVFTAPQLREVFLSASASQADKQGG
ncbi:MAG: selenium-dependent molybdenum cofactor biosynthesis protein YqeB [Anaerolineae bacterium]